MAVVGDAYIVVRAISNRVRDDIQKELNGIGSVGEKAGNDVARGYNRGLTRGGRIRLFSKEWFDEAERARITFRKLTIAQNFLFTALPGLLGAIGSLGTGLLVLVGVLGNAARGSIVLVSALGGLAQAAVTAKLAFEGVGDAIKAGLKAQKSSISNTRAEEAAARRLRDARLNLKRLLEEEKPEALAAAREAAVRAEEAVADALLSSERATRTYNSAQDETLDALNDLNKARDRAKERIQQLRFELEGGAISEKKARLEFEKARDSLQRVQDLPPNSRARQEAELAFAEAELNLRKAIDNNSDLKKAEEESTAAGVEGSQEVVDAKQRIADAQQAETDAGISAAKAAREVGRAQVAAAEAAAAAGSGGSAERDINRRIAAAREQVQLAEQAAGDAAAGGINEFQDALNKLAPAQQQFVKFIISQQEAFEGLRAAAGRQLFPQLEAALVIIIATFDELEPLIEETGAILGRLAMDFAETFFQGENFERLKRVWADNNGLLEALGTTVINLAEGLLILLDNARPLVTAFGDWAVSTSEAWKNTQILKDENGELTTEFERLQDRIERITGIFGTYKEAFGTIFDVINQPGGAGDQLLTYFEEGSQSFLDFVKAGQEDGSLDEFFRESTESFIGVLDVLKEIGKGLLLLSASPGVQAFIQSLVGVTETFNELGLELSGEGGPVALLGEFLEEFAILILNLTETGALQAFFETLVGFLTVTNDILENKIVKAILEAVAPLFGFVLAAGAIARSFKFLGKVVGGVFQLLVGGPKNAERVMLALKAKLKVFGAFLIKTLLPIIGRFAMGLLRFLLGPWGLVIALLLTFVPMVIRNWDKIVEFFKNMWTFLSEGFLAMWGAILDFFINAWNGISTWFTDTVFPFFVNLGPTLANAAKEIFSWFLEKLKDAWNFVVDFFATVIKFYFIDLPNAIAGFAGDVFGFLGDLIGTAWDNVSNFFSDTIFPFFQNLPKNLARTAGNVWDFLKDTFKNAINFVIDKWNNFKLELRLPSSVFGIPLPAGLVGKGVTIETPNIPRLAMGGIIKATSGGVAALIGEGGRNERIEPLDPSGLSQRDRAIINQLSGGGATINVYPSAGMDERDLADLVSRRLAFELRRGAA